MSSHYAQFFRLVRQVVRFCLLMLVGWLISLASWLMLPAIVQAIEPTTTPQVNPPPALYRSSASLPAQVEEGLRYYRLGQFDQAIQLWEAALAQTEQAKDRTILHTNLAKAYQQVGKPDQAIVHWHEVLALLGNDQPQQRVAVLTEQAQAYSQLGQHRRAIDLLTIAANSPTADAPTTAAVQGSLGNAYWALGDYPSALKAYQLSVTNARQSGNPATLATALNNIANLYARQSARLGEQAIAAMAEGEREESLQLSQQSQQHRELALAAYRESLALTNSPTTEISTLLNLNYLLAQAEDPDLRIIQHQRDRALARLGSQPDSRDKAYTLINLASYPLASDTPAQQQQWLQQALAIAQTIGDRRAESFALGTLGHLAESTNPIEAMRWTRAALAAAQAVNAADSLYRWQWQMGRLLKAQGDVEGAIVAYQQAVATLQSIRSDILAANRDLQFNFRDAVEPVYRELIDLLLNSESRHSSFVPGHSSFVLGHSSQEMSSLRHKFVPPLAPPCKGGEPDPLPFARGGLGWGQIVCELLPSSTRQPDNKGQRTKDKGLRTKDTIQTALDVLELLKLAELANFFGDECVQIAQAQSASTTIPADTVVIYSVILNDRTDLILRLPDGSLVNWETPIGAQTLSNTVGNLRTLLEKRTTEEYLPVSQQLYDVLIRPLEPALAEAKPKTIVFIQDGVLRKIPMAALHDGKQFLVEKVAIATAPSLSLVTLGNTNTSNLNALILGLTVARPPFAALTNVGKESQQVQAILGGTVLLNQDFTLARLEQALKQSNYPIIHLATHGKFGVDNDSTFLLGFDQRITIDQLDALLRDRAGRSPVELLTLSACQTATGDNRSALGIAGVAVRAGVRSAVATLWAINDESTVPLIETFYRQLRQPGVTKAEALRTAQLAMLNDLDWGHPAVWSPFILIGNWL